MKTFVLMCLAVFTVTAGWTAMSPSPAQAGDRVTTMSRNLETYMEYSAPKRVGVPSAPAVVNTAPQYRSAAIFARGGGYGKVTEVVGQTLCYSDAETQAVAKAECGAALLCRTGTAGTCVRGGSTHNNDWRCKC